MVGVGTALADDPELTPRSPGGGGRWNWKSITRVVLDQQLRLPPGCRMLRGIDRGPVVIFTAPDAPADRESALLAAGAEVLRTPQDQTGLGLDLHEVLRALGRRPVARVLLEGGATLFASAVSAGVVDRLSLFLAPKLLGGTMSLPLLNGLAGDDLSRAVELGRLSCRRVGCDVLVETVPVRRIGGGEGGD